jgi:hypothetical protein
MREISIKEMCKKVEDTVCGDGGIIVSLISAFGTVIIPYTDHLQISETDEQVILQDDNDINIVIKRSFICKSTVSRFEADDEQIELDLGETKISLLLCNY